MTEFWREFIPRDDYWITPLMALGGLLVTITIVIIAVGVWFRFVVWSIDQLTWWAA